MFEKQSQSVGEGALAIQAQGNVQVGISYESARQIALDVYQANFPLLVAEAAGLARARAEELTDKFLKRLSEVNPDGFNQAGQPDFQNALLNAQREHACAGDVELADLLVDLLVDRTKQEGRNLIRIVLDEALKTAPKLTDQQLAVLGANFLLGYSKSTSTTWAGVVSWFRTHLEPVLSEAVLTPSGLSHLQFTGCATFNGVVGSDIAHGIFETYAGFFQSGLTDAQVKEQALPSDALQYLKPLLGTDGLRWVAVTEIKAIDEIKADGRLSAEGAEKLKILFQSNLKTLDQFRDQVLLEMPFMKRAFDLWQIDGLGQITPTSVGTAIGHAFVKKTVGAEFAPLAVWIK